MKTLRLLLASGNPKKRAELERLLGPLGVAVVTPDEVGGLPEVVEDRPDFRGNAEKKARSAALASGLWALADDSGLEVEELDGAPGVRSARFAGEACDDAANNAKLLAALAGLPPDRRRARFTCVLALARPDGSIAAAIEGHAAGRILEAHRGTAGFGYDPLFLFDEPDRAEAGQSFAELDPDAKGRVSHRGRALRALARRLPELVGRSTPPSSELPPWTPA